MNSLPLLNREVGGLAQKKLEANIAGETYFDVFTRGRYSTDASIYQIAPIGVVVPRSIEDVRTVLSVANEEGFSILPRGGGTSQCGQTVNESVVIDVSKYLNSVLEVDKEERSAIVEPGVVLDQLNQILKPYGLWFPVDISTSAQATIGGMAGNNSCGARSIKYGTMRSNVLEITAILPDGSQSKFSPEDSISENNSYWELKKSLLQLGQENSLEIKSGFPRLMRRVGGYNIDALIREGDLEPNLSHILVGSEGTLAFSSQLKLSLSPLPEHSVLGICHFSDFSQAMRATKDIVSLSPTAVELVDKTMIDLASDIGAFKSVVAEAIVGEPKSVLLVEFAGSSDTENRNKLSLLTELMRDLRYPGIVLPIVEKNFQKAVWEVRKQALNIVMSMKGDGKPVSFVEDCAVELEDLPEYTRRLNNIFDKHGTSGTWYAHASVGTLHVRPILNLKLDTEVKKMRAIAEETFDMVKQYKGSHSGEHGDGIVRSEFHEKMFGKNIIHAFEQVKELFDPKNMMNPGKIVHPPAMDDRRLLRFKPEYEIDNPETKFNWNSWGGLGSAVEMCNNNGACRKLRGGSMCPSYRATKDEKHSTRGRANTLRLAMSGQFGRNSLTSSELEESLRYCLGCKACKRECPTGVDMARMKIEVLAEKYKNERPPFHDRVIAYFPHYAPFLSKVSSVVNLREKIPGIGKVGEWIFGLDAGQKLPRWAGVNRLRDLPKARQVKGPDAAVFVDCFNRYFEPDNIIAAVEVLSAGNRQVGLLAPSDGIQRPLCCGRTFLSMGLVDQAIVEAKRFVNAAAEHIADGVPILGLEPSCILSLREDMSELLSSEPNFKEKILLIEEYISGTVNERPLELELTSLGAQKIFVHGHCHQKASDALGATVSLLQSIPRSSLEVIDSGCCGMAGAFGYQAKTSKVGDKVGELDFLPTVRAIEENGVIAASGTSCRHQVGSKTNKNARHPIQLVRDALVIK